MARFLSLYGNVLLALQDELRKRLVTNAQGSFVPNLCYVLIDRSHFQSEHRQDQREQFQAIEEFRRLLIADIDQFVESHGWRLSGPFSLNILFDDLDENFLLKTAHCEQFFELTIRDDRGVTTIGVGQPSVIIGRDHSPAPRGFIPVHDQSRSLSREHLILQLIDGNVWIVQVGQNRTSCNGVEMEKEHPVRIEHGAEIVCGPHSIELTGRVEQLL